MEFVVSETRRPYDWFYEPDTQRYVRKDAEGTMNAHILGIHLPNPDEIRANLQRARREGRNTNGRADADPVTRKLWDHWHAKPHPQL